MALEDFTTYTILDPNNHITRSANNLDVNGLSQNEDAYIYKDMGVGYFGAKFRHDFTLRPQSINANWRRIGAAWGVSNVVNDARYWYDNNSQAIGMELIRRDTNDPYVRMINRELYKYSPDQQLSWYTNYYFTVERLSETQIQLRIYTDSGRTNLLYSAAIDVTSGRRFRYIFAINSYNTGDSSAAHAILSNLDLNPTNPYPVGLLKKGLISGYNCFLSAYLSAKIAGYDPLKTPDGAVF
jgi:hypothetical protein